MINHYFDQYQSLGLRVIPIEWDVEKKQPVSHTEWSKDIHYKVKPRHNGLMIHTNGDVACLDFDHKNASRQTIYQEWRQIIDSLDSYLAQKLYIEKTRNAGYHVWFKYPPVQRQGLADSPTGQEVIAVYAKGPLVYTFPSPGYEEVEGCMTDLVELTKEEYELITNTAQYFNEYKPTYDPNKKAISYPLGKEQLLSCFDNNITNEAWHQLLKQIGLEAIKNFRYNKKQHFAAYKRTGSTSEAISAKVYFKNKRICIFSHSMKEYPNWHDRHEYAVWSLSPSFVLFYKNNRDWDKAIEELRIIADSIGLTLPEETITTNFPMHVFPKVIADSIMEVSAARSLAPHFVATAGLWTVSSLAGTKYQSDFNGDSRNILFCLMVAPVSVGKTPAFKVMCETPLMKVQQEQDRLHKLAVNEHDLIVEQSSGKTREKKPSRYIPIAVDGTTEGYIHKSMVQPNGIGVYCDEAESILNAGSFKNNNDAVSFFTQAFSGGRITQIRADETKERVVPNLNLNLLMGTQPSRLANIFTEDRLASGFASRFLIIDADYQQLNIDADPFHEKKEMCREWVDLVEKLYWSGKHFNTDGQIRRISMPDGAKDVYRSYYKQLLTEANTRIQSKAESYVIGTEAKMSAYFPRLTQILALIHDREHPVITEQIVHYGWQLYRYYADSTIRILSSLHTEIETGLPKDLETLYQALPEEFSRSEAAATCARLNLNERRFDISIRRKDFAPLFIKTGHGQYRKK